MLATAVASSLFASLIMGSPCCLFKLRRTPRCFQAVDSIASIAIIDGRCAVDTGQLETLDRIVREGSFSRAAVALGIGQPAVSSRIQSLEETLGGALFTRARI